MCLAIPGKVLEINRSSEPVMGKVSFGGVKKEVCLELVPDVQVGEYVIVHVGFALNKMNEEEALETLRLVQELDAASESIPENPPDSPPKS